MILLYGSRRCRVNLFRLCQIECGVGITGTDDNLIMIMIVIIMIVMIMIIMIMIIMIMIVMIMIMIALIAQIMTVSLQ